MAFPLDESGQFNNTPSLICSNPANNEGLWELVCQLSGEFRPGDVVILASDALAAWLLQEHESEGKPWETLQVVGAGGMGRLGAGTTRRACDAKRRHHPDCH